MTSPTALLAAARPPRKAVVLTKEGLFGAGISGVILASPDEGGAWSTTLAEGPGGGSSKGAGVGVIVIEGAIQHRAQMGVCEAFVDGYDAIEARYDAAIEAYKAGEISRIVTVINSPGGARSGCFAGARRVRSKLVAAGVPSIAVADEDCCSAAWVWALASDKLYAPRDAKVGSIGAVCIAKSVKGALDREGIEVRVYRSGERKMRPSGLEAFTDEDDAYLQAETDAGGELIAEWTAERRGGTKDDYLALKGAVFSGQEAMRRGLIDGLYTAHEVIEMAMNDAARAEMAEALGLSATASEAEIKAALTEGKAAREQLSTVKAELARVEAERIATAARMAAQEKAQEAASRRAAFALEVKAACDAALLPPPTEAALMAHYDAHGEASARSAFTMAKSTTPIVKVDKVGSAPGTSAAPKLTLTDEQKAHADRINVSHDLYAERLAVSGKGN